MIKRFFEWIGLKERLNTIEKRPPLVSERDIWWISLGENIGSEISGKSSLFSRPALILKKLSRGFYLVAPSTSQHREGTWYVPITHEEKNMYICLHQIRTIDYRRFSSRLGQINSNDFTKIKEAFWKLYK